MTKAIKFVSGIAVTLCSVSLAVAQTSPNSGSGTNTPAGTNQGAANQQDPASQAEPAPQSNRQGLRDTSPSRQGLGTTDQARQGVATPQDASDRFFGEPGEHPWFGDEGVRQQLGLDRQRYDQLQQQYSDAYNNYQQRMRALRQDLTDQQRRARIEELRSGFANDFATWRDRAFADPEVRERYEQLYRQYQGYSAFDDRQLQSELGLTDAQRNRLDQHRSDWNDRMTQLYDSYRRDPGSIEADWQQMYSQRDERINSVLTPQQRQQWQQMQGEAYRFSPQTYFGSQSGARGNTARGQRGGANAVGDRDTATGQGGNPGSGTGPGAGVGGGPSRSGTGGSTP